MIMSREELSSAIKYPGDKSKVLSLLPIVKDPAGIKGNKERTLLHCAARNGWIDVCRLLVEQYQVSSIIMCMRFFSNMLPQMGGRE